MSWQKLKKEFESKGIIRCELCGSDQWLTPMHRLKRRYYTKDNLWDFNEVIISCQKCHERLEYNREETREVFNRLRPDNLRTSSRFVTNSMQPKE